MARAVVFAYHNVGVRCLRVLLAHGVEVPLVVTHDDNAAETIWFGSVAATARECGVPTAAPRDANATEFVRRVSSLAPDFVFSFYYRAMLKPSLLRIPPHGALNMHGSLLPRYRGRAPVNWAVLNGETETGASLHYMVAKPDAGALVDQQAVPIGPDDTAFEVAGRVADAAVTVLRRSLPKLIAGTATATPLDLARGSYFGGRRPADGEFRLDWPAARIHNLVRAVAPPFPGAFLRLGDALLRVHRTRRLDGAARHAAIGPCLALEGGTLIAECGDGARLELVDAYLDDVRLDAARFIKTFGHGPVPARPQPRAQARA